MLPLSATLAYTLVVAFLVKLLDEWATGDD